MVEGRGELPLGEALGGPAGPGRGQQRQHVGQGLVGDGRGPLHADHLAGVLHDPQAFHDPTVGDSEAGANSSCHDRWADQLTWSASSPTVARPAAAAASASRCAWTPPIETSMSVATPAAASCSTDCVRYRPSVASRARSPVDQQQPGRTGEAAQPADVGRGADHQRVDRALVGRGADERPAESAEPAPHPGGGQGWRGHGAQPAGVARCRWSTASTARR